MLPSDSSYSFRVASLPGYSQTPPTPLGWKVLRPLSDQLRDCGEPAISLHSHHVSLVQWTTCLLPVTRDPGSNPQGGYLCETGILLLALSSYKTLFAMVYMTLQFICATSNGIWRQCLINGLFTHIGRVSYKNLV
jgi:hypothetical protein